MSIDEPEVQGIGGGVGLGAFGLEEDEVRVCHVKQS
jgi:hypothetical protein